MRLHALLGLVLMTASAHPAAAAGFLTPEFCEALEIEGYGTDAGWGTSALPILTGDVTGDGSADVVAFGQYNAFVAESNGESFADMEPWGLSLGYPGVGFIFPRPPMHAMLGDVSGDGAADLVLFTAEGTNVMLAYPADESFESPQRWSGDFGIPFAAIDEPDATEEPGFERHLADMNGDQLLDIVLFDPTGIRVGISTGDQFLPIKRWLWGYGGLDGWGVDNPRLLADVDGDRQTDAVLFSNLGPVVALSTGQGFRPPRLWVQAFGASSLAGGWTGADESRQLADVNGDGRADVVGFGDGGTYVALSTGNSFGEPELWLGDFGTDQGYSAATRPRLLADIDGDGKDDIVGFGAAGTFAATSTGSSFAPKSKLTDAFQHGFGLLWQVGEHPRGAADVNGDGQSDLIGVYDDGVHLFVTPPPPTVYGWPLSEAEVCYAPVESSQAEALKASCTPLCDGTQPYISDHSLCEDDAFWASPCGLLEMDRMSAAADESDPYGSECTEALVAYADETDFSALGQTGATVAPPLEGPDGTTAGGVTTGVLKIPADRSKQRFTGMTGHYYGERMRNWTNLSSGDFIEELIFGLTRAIWQASGPALSSCRELVHEKYYDIARYLDVTAAMGADHWAMFDIAYNQIALTNPDTGENWKAGQTWAPLAVGAAIPSYLQPTSLVTPPEAIGQRAIEGTGPNDVLGVPLDPFIPTTPRHKNAYFESPVETDPVLRANIKAIAAVATGTPENIKQLCMKASGMELTPETCPWLYLALEDDSLYSTLRQGRLNHQYVESWEWHKEKGTALRAEYLEEELEVLQFNQERFLFLLKLRHDLVREFHELIIASVVTAQEQTSALNEPLLALGVYDPGQVVDPIGGMLQSQKAERTGWLRTSLMDAAVNQIPGAGGDVVPDFLGSGLFLVSGGSGPPTEDSLPVLVETAHGLSSPNGSVFVEMNPDVLDLIQPEQTYVDPETQIQKAGALPAQIEQANALIEAELQKAKAQGCLDLTVDNPCDWAPKLFVQRLQDHFEAKGELDYQRCLDEQTVPLEEIYANGLSLETNGEYPDIVVETATGETNVECRAGSIAAADPYLAGAVSPSSPADWTAAPRLAEYFPRCFRAFQALAIEQAAEALGGLDNVFEGGNQTDVSLAQADSDSNIVGSDKFGLEMGYDFGWNLPTFESATNCQIDPYVNAEIHMNGKVFGLTIPIFDAGAKAGIFSTPADQALGQREFEADAWIEVLSFDLLDTDVFPVKSTLTDYTYNILVEGSPAESWQQEIIQVIIPIAFVPLSLKVGIAGALGLKYEIAGGVPAGTNCEDGWIRVRGELAPFAGLDVFASVGIDLLFIEAGIQINLTLVELALPFSVDLTMGADPPVPGKDDTTYIELVTALDMRLTFLSGSLKAFLEIFYIIGSERIEATIFEWDGPSHTINLFTAVSRIDLGPLRVVQGALNAL